MCIQKRTAMKTQAAVCVSMVTLSFGAPVVMSPSAKADTQCPYPGVGILNVNVGGVGGGFCDFPTEINGSHWHCQGGGASLGLAATGVGVGSMGTLGLAGVGQGVGGVSCNWRCPDGTDAPAPNLPARGKNIWCLWIPRITVQIIWNRLGFGVRRRFPPKVFHRRGKWRRNRGKHWHRNQYRHRYRHNQLPESAVPPTAPGEPNP